MRTISLLFINFTHIKQIFKLLLTLFPVFGPGYLFAQKESQAFVDSLLKELPKVKEDSGKVKLLLNIVSGLSVLDPEHGYDYGKQALDLAVRLHWKPGIGRSY